MKDHRLKTIPASFGALADGVKSFTVRLDDRGFQTGESVFLDEWLPDALSFTGKTVAGRIAYIHEGLGMQPGYVVLGLEEITRMPDWEGGRTYPEGHQQCGE